MWCLRVSKNKNPPKNVLLTAIFIFIKMCNILQFFFFLYIIKEWDITLCREKDKTFLCGKPKMEMEMNEDGTNIIKYI